MRTTLHIYLCISNKYCIYKDWVVKTEHENNGTTSKTSRKINTSRTIREHRWKAITTMDKKTTKTSKWAAKIDKQLTRLNHHKHIDSYIKNTFVKEKKNRDTLTSNNTCTRTKERQTRNKTTKNTYEKERKRHKKKEGEETKKKQNTRRVPTWSLAVETRGEGWRTEALGRWVGHPRLVVVLRGQEEGREGRRPHCVRDLQGRQEVWGRGAPGTPAEPKEPLAHLIHQLWRWYEKREL